MSIGHLTLTQIEKREFKKTETSAVLNSRWQVSKERGEQLAIEYGIKFMETSAKASINVEDAFFTLARDIKVCLDSDIEIYYLSA